MTIRISDFDASKRFYTTVLEPLHRNLDWEDSSASFAEWGDFSIAQDGGPVTRDLHIAFAASNRKEVDDFHAAALGGGYRDNGEPGERPQYHPGYYAAFVLDPDSCIQTSIHRRRSKLRLASRGLVGNGMCPDVSRAPKG